jgi:hypothetical protein
MCGAAELSTGSSLREPPGLPRTRAASTRDLTERRTDNETASQINPMQKAKGKCVSRKEVKTTQHGKPKEKSRRGSKEN